MPKRHIFNIKQTQPTFPRPDKPVVLDMLLGSAEQNYHPLQSEYGNMNLYRVKRLKALEPKNARLGKAVSYLTLDKLILREALDALNLALCCGSAIQPEVNRCNRELRPFAGASKL